MFKALIRAAASVLGRMDERMLGLQYFPEELCLKLVELEIRAQFWVATINAHSKSEEFRRVRQFAEENKIPFRGAKDAEEFVVIRFRLEQISSLPEIAPHERPYSREWCQLHSDLFDDVGYMLDFQKDPERSKPFRDPYEQFHSDRPAQPPSGKDMPSVTLDLFGAYQAAGDLLKEQLAKLGASHPIAAHPAKPAANL